MSLGNYRGDTFNLYCWKYHAVGHKLYNKFDHYVDLAHDKGIKVEVLTWRKVFW